MRAPTLRDVAGHAGVSVATVSLVLSGKGASRVTDETAARIVSAAESLGYRANRLARGLRAQSTRVLGLLSIEVATTPYAGTMLRGAQQAARARDHDLLFHEVSLDLAEMQEGLDLLAEHQVDGVLIANYFHRAIPLPDRLPDHLVLLDCYSEAVTCDSVVVDEVASMDQALDLLADMGHRTVAYVGEQAPYPAAQLRRAAFAAAVARHGWDDDPALVELLPDSIAAAGYSGMHALWQRRPDVTAVACYTDRMAMGLYEACWELGISIPGDLSVVGFDDQTLISEALRPGLTTVALPHLDMGRWAVDRLIDRCEATDESRTTQVAIPGVLVRRESVGSPRG